MELAEALKLGLKASRGPRDGVLAVNVPEGWAVKNVPLGVSVDMSHKSNTRVTYEAVRREMISSLPDSLETTQTVLTSVGSNAARTSDGLSSSAPSGASGTSIGAATTLCLVLSH